MAFPSSSGTNALGLSQALQNAQNIAGQIKQQAQAFAAQAIGPGIVASQLVGIPALWTSYNTALSTYGAVPGMQAYAQAQLGNVSLDIASAFTAMQAAITSTVAWIQANFPASGGFLQYVQFRIDGNLTYTTFTPAQLTGFLTQLNALIATIN
jgi:hypothetical protein